MNLNFNHIARSIRLLIILIAVLVGYNIPIELYAKAKSVKYSTADGMSHDKSQGFYQDSSGIIWVCTWYGIDRFDGYKFTNFRPLEELNAQSRFKEAFSANDTLFIKTLNGTVLSFDINACRFDRINDSIPKRARRLRRNFTDRKGNVWCSTSSGISLSINSNSDYSVISNDDYPYARAIFEDSTGKIWISWCSDSDVNPLNGEVVTYDSSGNPQDVALKGNAIYSIMEDNQKNIWLGTRNNGLVILSPDKNGKYRRFDYYASSFSGYLSHNSVFDILQDSHGQVWIATLGGGLNFVDSNYDVSNLVFQVPERYPIKEYPRVRSLHEHANSLFIGTDTGILRVRNDRKINDMIFTPLSSEGMQPAEEIIHLTPWTDDAFLISSFGKGIYEYSYKTGTFSPLVAENFAEKQPVYAALAIDSLSLWVTARTEILLYDLTKDDSYITPVGTRLNILETKPLLDSRGYAWFSSMEGVIRVDEPSAMTGDKQDNIVFTDITYFRGDSTIMKILSHKDSMIYVEPDMRDLSLSVSAMDFGKLDGVKYYWRILEQDTIWSEIDGKNSLTLTKLTPGNKTVEIRSTDPYGRLLDNTGSLTLVVKPRWHEHIAFRIAIGCIVVIFITLLIFTIFKYRRLQKIYLSILNSKAVAKVSAAMIDIKPEESLTEADNRFISEINRKIDDMIGDPKFSIDSVAASMGMSRSVFYRRLKSVVGQSPSEYINRYRLSKAASMLREHHDRSVASIAYDCGFSSPQYFSNLFRKEYQMTPNEWRKIQAFDRKA